MTTRLIAWVEVPHFLAHVAGRARPPGPLVVAQSPSDRAQVIDLNRAAARAGIRIGMPVLEARRRCRQVQIATVEWNAATALATTVADVLRQFGDNVQTAGVGQWNVHLAALGMHCCHAEETARELRHAVQIAIGTPVTVGLAVGPHLARIAARVAGERGVAIMLPGSEAAFLAPLPVTLLPGIGAQSGSRLQRLGVDTIAQFRAVPLPRLRAICGCRAETALHIARGIEGDSASVGSRRVTATWEAPGEPCADQRHLEAHLHVLTTGTGRQLRAMHEAAGELTLAVTWLDGSRSQRSERDEARRDLDAELQTWSRAALRALLTERRLGVRSLTITLADLGPRQVDLFGSDDARPRRLQHALDTLARRFGSIVVLPAALIGIGDMR